jgi:hypothetical protein
VTSQIGNFRAMRYPTNKAKRVIGIHPPLTSQNIFPYDASTNANTPASPNPRQYQQNSLPDSLE